MEPNNTAIYTDALASKTRIRELIENAEAALHEAVTHWRKVGTLPQEAEPEFMAGGEDVLIVIFSTGHEGIIFPGKIEKSLLRPPPSDV